MYAVGTVRDFSSYSSFGCSTGFNTRDRSATFWPADQGKTNPGLTQGMLFRGKEKGLCGNLFLFMGRLCGAGLQRIGYSFLEQAVRPAGSWCVTKGWRLFKVEWSVWPANCSSHGKGVSCVHRFQGSMKVKVHTRKGHKGPEESTGIVLLFLQPRR